MSTAVAHAQALVERGDIHSAAALLNQADKAGDALAARELGVWLLEGRLVRRNLAASRAQFERAAALGDEESATIVRAFVAGGVGGPADWRRAIDLLRRAAETDPAAARQLKLIEAMALGLAGEPLGEFDERRLSGSLDVRVFPALFTLDECRYLVDAATPKLQPSVVVDPATGREIPHPIRTSSGTGFPYVEEDPAIHALSRRLAAASGTDVKAGEPLNVLRYSPGEQYREHSDALPGVAPHQQRVMTFLVYLDDGYEGGETAFPMIGLEVRGRAGDGLLFRNAADDGVPDPRSVHAGLPVTRGVKHIASRWIRAEPLIVE